MSRKKQDFFVLVAYTIAQWFYFPFVEKGWWFIRQRTEQWEREYLSEFACLSAESRGRDIPIEPCPIRTEFQRDRDRLIHSKAFRRLKQKTQVFIIPEGDHYRTRLTHTLEVAQISRTIARGLRLNEDLTEAICMGHDLGHTPFGHAGEEVLNAIHPGGFRHNEQSLRIVETLEDGMGLNLTWEVRDGILNHTGKNSASTLEGRVVKIADRIAYINHDIDDAIRSKIISTHDLPKACLDILGYTHGARIHTMVSDIIFSSEGKGDIHQSSEIAAAMNELRAFMFKNVYLGSEAKKEEQKVKEIVAFVYRYFCSHPEQLEQYYTYSIKDQPVEETVKDFVAGMTDRFLINLYRELTLPKPWMT